MYLYVYEEAYESALNLDWKGVDSKSRIVCRRQILLSISDE